MAAKKLRKIKIDASELQAKYAALETEIRLLCDLRSQVSTKLKKQVQAQVRWSRRVSDVLESPAKVPAKKRRGTQKRISPRSIGTLRWRSRWKIPQFPGGIIEQPARECKDYEEDRGGRFLFIVTPYQEAPH